MLVVPPLLEIRDPPWKIAHRLSFPTQNQLVSPKATYKDSMSLKLGCLTRQFGNLKTSYAHEIRFGPQICAVWPITQGPRNNFEIGWGGGGGGGGPLVTQYWGGTKHFYLLILYNFKNIGGHVPPVPTPSPLYSAVPETIRICTPILDYVLISLDIR